MFAYFGPETTLPVASVLAGVVGFVLMVGRASRGMLGRLLRSVVEPGAERSPRGPWSRRTRLRS